MPRNAGKSSSPARATEPSWARPHTLCCDVHRPDRFVADWVKYVVIVALWLGQISTARIVSTPTTVETPPSQARMCSCLSWDKADAGQQPHQDRRPLKG